MIKPQTLKGFRDFLPPAAIKRQYVINKIQKVFEKYGFDPLETPALEYAETLTGKYGDDADKLLYLFLDNGGRKVGLRYDQTVPLSRVAAQYTEIIKPFKRYQIQPVWRAENTQKGRYREFLQCDADIIGDNFAPTADAEILTVFWSIYQALGFNKFKIKVNSRNVLRKLILGSIQYLNESEFENLNPNRFFSIIRILDKLPKIGENEVRRELIEKLNLIDIEVTGLFEALKRYGSLNYKQIKEIDQNLFYSLQMAIENFNVPEESLIFDPTLARGLDYYTGLIFEGFDESYKGSLGGGGRYDKLIGQFTGKDISAVGFAIGFDRTLEVASKLNLLPETKTKTQVLVTTIEDWKKVFPTALGLVTQLRNSQINAELYLNPQEKIDKQFKYADRKGIPYVIVVGPNEVNNRAYKLKDMKTKEQEELSTEGIIEKLTQAN